MNGHVVRITKCEGYYVVRCTCGWRDETIRGQIAKVFGDLHVREAASARDETVGQEPRGKTHVCPDCGGTGRKEGEA